MEGKIQHSEKTELKINWGKTGEKTVERAIVAQIKET